MSQHDSNEEERMLNFKDDIDASRAVYARQKELTADILKQVEALPPLGDETDASEGNSLADNFVRDMAFASDMGATREKPQSDPQYEGEPSKIAIQLIHEVHEFLHENGVRSKDELRFLTQKLDTAIALNNDPDAKKLRADLIERYGDDARK